MTREQQDAKKVYELIQRLNSVSSKVKTRMSIDYRVEDNCNNQDGYGFCVQSRRYEVWHRRNPDSVTVLAYWNDDDKHHNITSICHHLIPYLERQLQQAEKEEIRHKEAEQVHHAWVLNGITKELKGLMKEES